MRFRESVIKNKFGKIKNRKLRQDFLTTIAVIERCLFNRIQITIEDIIKEIEDFDFTHKEKYCEYLEKYKEKQKVLDKYAKEKKDVNND